MSPRRDIAVSEIAVMLADRIEPLAAELLPNGHEKGRYWIEAQQAEGGLGDSLKLHMSGERRGRWRHYAPGVGGDALDLVGYLKGLSKAESVAWAKAWLGINGDARPSRPVPTTRDQSSAGDHADDARQRTEAAVKIWSQAGSAIGSLVETYLKTRGIDLPPPPTIRYSAALKHGPTGLVLPAMVAAVQAIDRRVIGVHRTFLRMDGTGKAPVETPKMSLGPISGGAVRLGPARSPLAIAEGIETALAIAQSCPELSVWAAISTAGLKAIKIPREIHEVVIFADGDEAGRDAAGASGARLTSEGHEVRVAHAPEGQDFADVLNQGAAA